MFDFDFRRTSITIALLGAVISGTTIALVLLAWPWLWALINPTLHAWTV